MKQSRRRHVVVVSIKKLVLLLLALSVGLSTLAIFYTVATLEDDANTALPESILEEIILRWNLTNVPRAKKLLKQIWIQNSRQKNAYDPQRDLIIFHHPIKSGGTSVSEILNGLGDVVPGSKASAYFSFKEFNETYLKEVVTHNKSLPHRHEGRAAQEWWDNKKVLYSHSKVRDYQPGAPKRKLVQLFQRYMPTSKHKRRRRLRLITMVRDPVDYVASNFHEWFCDIRSLTKVVATGVLHLSSTRRRQQEPRTTNNSTTTQCSNDYTLEDLTQARIYWTQQQCQNITTEAEIDALETKREQRNCRAFRHYQNQNNTTSTTGSIVDFDPQPECTSIPAFFASPKFDEFFFNMYQNYTTATTTTTTRTQRKTEDAAWVEAALEYLGGLDTPVGQLDVMWFGITERMMESMCLFHYQTGLPHRPTPTHRLYDKHCRPTRFWSQQDRAVFQNRQRLDYAVHRAANAIMDLKLIHMRQDLWHRIHTNNKEDSSGSENDLESMPFTTAKCLGPPPPIPLTTT